VILGQVLTAAQGQNPARQASMAAGVPKEVPAWGVKQVCGSGLRAVALAAQAIQTGDSQDRRRGRAGEHVARQPRPGAAAGTKMGDVSLVDTMIKDGLTDVFNGYHMGITAENLAEQYQVTRGEQDEFAVARRTRPRPRAPLGRFKDEIAPVTIKGRKGDTIVEDDEYIRAGATVEGIAGLRPAFKKDGTVTAANASGPQRRRRRAGGDEPRGSREARRADPRDDQELGHGRRRSFDHGHRAGPGVEARRWKRPAGRSPIST
jgi:acetyl-CoA C-acetyltransferase